MKSGPCTELKRWSLVAVDLLRSVFLWGLCGFGGDTKKTCGFGATPGFGGDIPLFFGFGGDFFLCTYV